MYGASSRTQRGPERPETRREHTPSHLLGKPRGALRCRAVGGPNGQGDVIEFVEGSNAALGVGIEALTSRARGACCGTERAIQTPPGATRESPPRSLAGASKRPAAIR